jgi:hypothetical protein
MSKELTKVSKKLVPKYLETVVAAAIEYELLNQQEKLLKTRRDKVFRPIIEPATDAYGTEDANGHLHFIPEKGTEIVRTKKVSRVLNTVAAEKLIEEKGIQGAMVEVVSYEVDEEKLIDAYNCGIISAAELDSIFDERISYATSVKTDDPQVKEIESARKSLEKAETIPEIES